MREVVGVWLFWQWGGHLCVTPCELKGACFFCCNIGY